MDAGKAKKRRDIWGKRKKNKETGNGMA